MHNNSVRVEKISEMLGHLDDPDYPFMEEARNLSDDELAFLCQRHGTLYRLKHHDPGGTGSRPRRASGAEGDGD